MRAFLAVLALLLVPATAAASPQTDLDAAKARWAAQPYAGDYGFSINLACFCPARGPFPIVVVDGVARDPDPGARSFTTIEGLFSRIQAQIDSGQGTFSVTYDAFNGVPLSYGSDPIPYAVDDEFGWTVSRVHALAPSVADGSAAAKLAAARKRWRKLGWRNYNFRVSTDCDCHGGVGISSRKYRVRKGRSNIADSPLGTVPKLFRRIDEVLATGPSTLDVRFGRTGLPRLIHHQTPSIELLEPTEFEIRAKNLRRVG